MLRTLFVIVLLSTSARADGTVALLPLDAGAKLEVYGQAVASEIAQALIAGKLDVVVVLPKMAVPVHATLVVGGKLSAGKAKGSIDLSISLRAPNSPTALQSFQATAASLEALPKTTTELAQKILPAVRDKLAELTKPVVEPIKNDVPPPVREQPKALPVAKPLLVGIVLKGNEALRTAIAETIPAWLSGHGRVPTVIEASMLDKKQAPKTVAGSTADRAIAFEVLGYELWGKDVPLAKARVRVRIADAGVVLFDRVVVTDTVVGERAMAVDQFAMRVAREVFAILEPHARRTVPGW